jgi:hypothetical protein
MRCSRHCYAMLVIIIAASAVCFAKKPPDEARESNDDKTAQLSKIVSGLLD